MIVATVQPLAYARGSLGALFTGASSCVRCASVVYGGGALCTGGGGCVGACGVVYVARVLCSRRERCVRGASVVYGARAFVYGARALFTGSECYVRGASVVYGARAFVYGARALFTGRERCVRGASVVYGARALCTGRERCRTGGERRIPSASRVRGANVMERLAWRRILPKGVHMRFILLTALALPLSAQTAHTPRGTATDVSSDDVQATLKKTAGAAVSDQAIRVVHIEDGYNVGIGVVHRAK